MQENKLYRTLFLLDETRSYTNDFYLAEFAKIVLFRDFRTLDIDDLKVGIEELTSLEYTEEDIIHAIAMNCQGQITVHNGQYSLSESAFKELAQRDKTNHLKSFISEYISANPGKYDISLERAEELIDSFIFQRFNDNLQQISEILNHRISIQSEDKDYEDSEKAFINEFLRWNNPAKNKQVFLLIAKSYDYFMINSRCEDPAFDFSTMNFYVDTNILFRLMGLNGKVRESSVRSLIEKCRSVGINLLVSNYVRSECEASIDRQINILIDYTNAMNKVIPPSSMSFAEEQSVKSDFYAKYYHWVKSGNKHKNYDAFKRYIHRELDDLLKGFTSDNGNVSYETKPESGYFRYREALENIKKDAHTIKTDVNSFLLVRDRRTDNSQQSYYLISADIKLVSWLWDTFPGEKSIADYPSAWLSIILKYSGREKDSDYKAFCQLVHLSIHPKVEDLEKKLKVKSSIVYSNLDERIQIGMIDEVRDHYSQYKDLSEAEIIKYSYAKTVERIEKDTEQRILEESSRMIDEMAQKWEAKLQRQEEESNRQAAEIKRLSDAEKVRIMADKESEKQKEIDDERKKVITELRQKETDRIIGRNKKIRLVFALTALGLILVAIVILIVHKTVFDNKSSIGQFFTNNSFLFEILFLVGGAIVAILRLIFGNYIFPVDKETVEKTVEKRITTNTID